MGLRKYLFPALALAGTAMTVFMVASENNPVARSEPNGEPRHELPLTSVGLIEASTRNIAIGTPVPGLVTRVFVNVGDEVQAGAPLFSIDDRSVRAELEIRKATLHVAEQTLSRLQKLPRPEDVPAAEAKVTEVEAQFEDAQTQLSISEAADQTVARKVVVEQRSAVSVARARLAQARAQLKLLRAGTWNEDLEVARAQAELAHSQIKAAETDLQRLIVRAPVDGQVLQVSIQAGEFAPTGALATPLMLFGATRTLHVRVDVDENDAWRVRPRVPAHARLRGNPSIKTDLTFVRIEPYVLPKKSLTGDSTERVDARVLQVLYSFPRGNLPLYVGQQMDVFIDAPESGKIASTRPGPT